MTRYPPGPKGVPFLGHLHEYHRDPLGLLLRLARVHGDLVHFKLGPQHMFLLNHPDYIKDVLVTADRNFVKGRAMQFAKRVIGQGLLTSEGEFHSRQRRFVEPAFHRQRLNAYGSVVTTYGSQKAEQWHDGATVDMAHEMTDLTLAVVGKALFDTDLESDSEGIRQALLDSMTFLNTAMLPLLASVAKLPFPSALRFQRAQASLDKTIYRLIDKRQADGEDRGDLLSMLLLARDEVDGSRMSARQVRDEALTIRLTGHETMASAMSWSLYLLSQHPEEEKRLHAELDQVLGGRVPTFEDLQNLTRVRMFLSEALRLYPPAWAVARRAVEDYSVANYVV